MGTAAYMSPEQARGKTVDKRTDIWAFGCCLYETLTGRKAFGGETVTDVLAAVVKTEPDWRPLPDTTPWKVRELLERCLRKDPSRRLHDVADARIDIDDALGEPSIVRPPPAKVDRRGTVARAALAMVVAAALGATATWFSVRAPKPQQQPITRLTISLPEEQTLAGRALPFAISPDGMHLVYAAEAGATQNLYLRELDDFEAKLLPDTEGASNPFFSPDGRWVGFYADGHIKKISTTGGAATTLCEASPFMGKDRGGGSFWQTDDTIIHSDAIRQILLIPANGGAPEPLTSSQFSGYPFWPHMLPGGKNLLVTDLNDREESLLSLLSMETAESRVLLRGSAASFQARYLVSGHLVYAQSGGLWAVPFDISSLELTGSPVSVLDSVHEVPMTSNEPVTYFAVADTGTLIYAAGGVAEKTSLVWVDRDGRETLLGEHEERLSNPRLSPDGTRVALWVSSPGGSDIWVYDVDRGTRTRLTFGAPSFEPVWSPEGARIAFAGDFDVNWIPADGSATAQTLVARRDIPLAPSSWSPDGRTLALYEINPNTARNIYVMQIDGDSTPTPILATEFNEHSPMFSPDGRWLAYVSDESGREEVYVRALSGSGAKHPISMEGGREPVWSADGRELFYRNGDKMMVVAVQTEPDFNTGTARVLFEGRYAMGSGGGNNYDVTPDGRRFLMVRSDVESAPNQINVILNWAEELKRLAPTENQEPPR
jgi:serine/threonine-protein kinase